MGTKALRGVVQATATFGQRYGFSRQFLEFVGCDRAFKERERELPHAHAPVRASAESAHRMSSITWSVTIPAPALLGARSVKIAVLADHAWNL
jgi:hypothetical protein